MGRVQCEESGGMNWPAKPKKVAYVVLKGRTPGIYDNWPEARAQVHQYEGAVFKGYETYEAAIEVWDAWEEKGEDRIRKAHTKTRSGKLNPKGKVESRDRLPRIRAYAQEVVRKFSDGKGFGSHVTTVNN